MREVIMPVGDEIFDQLRIDGKYYVDKTEMICRLVQEAHSTVMLFTRPRRFGKTLAMHMLKSFFDILKDSREIFEGLAVAAHEEICRKWMNQYPTVYLSLKDVHGFCFEDAYGHLKAEIADLFIEFEFLESSDRVSSADLKRFAVLKEEGGSSVDVERALKLLTRMLHAHFGKQAILLIDEYDVPVAKAHESKYDQSYYDKMLGTVSRLMSTALKSNEHLKFAVVTGCLKIAKESIFTGVNNFSSYSILDRKFSDSFGFTDADVKKLLSDAGLKERAEEVKKWYDGYFFGDTEIYCPWDVVNYVEDIKNGGQDDPKNYWANTSSNVVIKNFIDHNEWNLQSQFEKLLNGKSIQHKINSEMTYADLEKSEDNFWSVLFMTGYLTKASGQFWKGTADLRIPNKEIAGIFENTVVTWFDENLDRSRLAELMTGLWEGDVATVSDIISGFLFNTISYNDYHEDFYHAFVTGVFTGLGYPVESNREHGLGRTDIVLMDRQNRRAVILEAKKAAEERKLDAACEEGLRQIVNEQYGKGVANGFREVLCYSMAFYKKTCMVKKLEI